MVGFGLVLLWLLAGISLVAMAATLRYRTPVAWLSGFLTAAAVADTVFIVAMNVR